VATADGSTFGAFVRALLLCAQRRHKVATMKWADLKDGEWTIPWDEREKFNAGSLRLPPAILELINARPRIDGCPYVFAAAQGKGQGGQRAVADDLAWLVLRTPFFRRDPGDRTTGHLSGSYRPHRWPTGKTYPSGCKGDGSTVDLKKNRPVAGPIQLYQPADWLTHGDFKIACGMIQRGKRRVFAMGQAIPVRTDYSAGEVRQFAKRAKDAAQARRLLAIAAVLDGTSREPEQSECRPRYERRAGRCGGDRPAARSVDGWHRA
jgi:hypothetical protein